MMQSINTSFIEGLQEKEYFLFYTSLMQKTHTGGGASTGLYISFLLFILTKAGFANVFNQKVTKRLCAFEVFYVL